MKEKLKWLNYKNFRSIIFVAIISLMFPFSTSANENENKGHKMDHSQHKMDYSKHKSHHPEGMGHIGNMKMGQNKGTKKQDIAMGKMIYEMTCIFCHGSEGKGDGPAAIFIGPYSAPRPRNFTQGVFKFRSTESGELPIEFDLMRTVRDGIPGYMPSFRHLGRDKLRQVVLYVTQFYKDLIDEESVEKIKIDHSVSFTQESIQRGRKIYDKMKCFECHGHEGLGDGPAAKTLKDDFGFPIKPGDLTQPSAFKNGNNHEDIYRTIMTGLTGTPMPSFIDSFKGNEHRVWDLVHYILSLSPEDEWTRMGRAK